MASLQNPCQMSQATTKYLPLHHHHHHHHHHNIPPSLKHTHIPTHSALKIPTPKLQLTAKLAVMTDSENPHLDFKQNHSNSKNITAGKMQRRFMNGIALMAAVSVFADVNACYSSTPEDSFVRNTVSSYNIVIFSKSYCPYCRRAKDVFKELRQVPHVVELDERDDGESIQDAISKIVGRRTVPQVFIGGKHLGGLDDTIEACQNGELAKLLGIESSDLADDL